MTEQVKALYTSLLDKNVYWKVLKANQEGGGLMVYMNRGIPEKIRPTPKTKTLSNGQAVVFNMRPDCIFLENCNG